MATVIQIKRSSATTAPSTLKQGEIAYTYGSGIQSNGGDRLYIGTGAVDSNGDASSIDVIGGKYFSDLTDHAHGTLTASSALIVDSNLAIDQLNIGNSTTTGGAIKLNEGTNNGTEFVQLKAPNSLASSTIYTFPTAYGTNGQFLKTDAAGQLSWDTVNQFINLAGDTGTDQYNTAETLTFTGGTGLDTEITDNELTINITNSGVDTLQIANDAVTNAKLDTNGELTLGSTGLQLGQTNTDLAGLTSLVVDDITINGSTVSTTASNIDITLSPHGTGTVVVPSGYDTRAGFTADSLVNKAYVDAIAEGLHVHASTKAATTQTLAAESGDTVTYNNGSSGVGATLTLSTGISTLDGHTLVDGERVLIKDETNQAHNGIYIRTSSTVFTRADDFDTTAEVASGDFLFVEEGTVNANNGFVQTETTTAIGTSNIIFEQFSGAGQITAGNGMSKSGNILDVNVDGSSIEITADALNVKAGGITNAMLSGSIQTSKLNNPVLYFTDETSTQGQVSLEGTLEFLAGEGINTVVSGNTLTISGELASTSNVGVASFTSDNFAVSGAGEVSVIKIDGETF